MSDTPRTDAIKPRGSFHEFFAEDYADLARQLERELAESRKLLERAKNSLAIWTEDLEDEGIYESVHHETLTAINNHLNEQH